MRRKIRRCVFETNSSSTHSVSILNRNKIKYSDIPKNSKVVLNDTYEYGTDIFDEIGKLNYIVTMLASIAEYQNDCDALDVEKTFEAFINLNWFKWLAEVVKEESNTDVIYECPISYRGTYKTSFPYYDITYDEDETIEYIFTDGDEEILTDKNKFKERVKDIIYNKSIIIEDKENEY